MFFCYISISIHQPITAFSQLQGISDESSFSKVMHKGLPPHDRRAEELKASLHSQGSERAVAYPG